MSDQERAPAAPASGRNMAELIAERRERDVRYRLYDAKKELSALLAETLRTAKPTSPQVGLVRGMVVLISEMEKRSGKNFDRSYANWKFFIERMEKPLTHLARYMRAEKNDEAADRTLKVAAVLSAAAPVVETQMKEAARLRAEAATAAVRGR